MFVNQHNIIVQFFNGWNHFMRKENLTLGLYVAVIHPLAMSMDMTSSSADCDLLSSSRSTNLTGHFDACLLRQKVRL